MFPTTKRKTPSTLLRDAKRIRENKGKVREDILKEILQNVEYKVEYPQADGEDWQILSAFHLNNKPAQVLARSDTCRNVEDFVNEEWVRNFGCKYLYKIREKMEETDFSKDSVSKQGNVIEALSGCAYLLGCSLWPRNHDQSILV